MSVVVSSILADAAVFLNDASQSRFTNTSLLPYVKRAYRELQLQLHLNDFDTLREVSSNFTISAGATVITGQPADLIEPIGLQERAASSSELFIPMYRVQF